MADTMLCPQCESPYADFNVEVTATVSVSAPVYVERHGRTRWGVKPSVGHDTDFSNTVDRVANAADWREAEGGGITLRVNVESAEAAGFHGEEVIRVSCDNCGFVAEGDDYNFDVDLDYLPSW